MAKQVGPVYYSGTIGMICFYKMKGQYYARMKSSLTGRRVKKDPAFKRTMQNANILGEASRIASAVYRSVKGEQKSKELYRTMTGIAIRMLKQGFPAMKVLAIMEGQFLQPRVAAVKEIPRQQYTIVVSSDAIETGNLCINENGELKPIRVDWPPKE